jgi:hypothetical protein
MGISYVSVIRVKVSMYGKMINYKFIIIRENETVTYEWVKIY